MEASRHDPDLREHVVLLLEKLGMTIRTESRFGITDFSIHDSSGRMVSMGHFHPDSLGKDELPIPYERIYLGHLSNQSYYISFGDPKGCRFDFFHFPDLEPKGRFCLEVDLMPYS